MNKEEIVDALIDLDQKVYTLLMGFVGKEKVDEMMEDIREVEKVLVYLTETTKEMGEFLGVPDLEEKCKAAYEKWKKGKSE